MRSHIVSVPGGSYMSVQSILAASGGQRGILPPLKIALPSLKITLPSPELSSMIKYLV